MTRIHKVYKYLTEGKEYELIPYPHLSPASVKAVFKKEINHYVFDYTFDFSNVDNESILKICQAIMKNEPEFTMAEMPVDCGAIITLTQDHVCY